jgi:16S rRNA A1518/A1519 N6-dimethyltransferase RsmA/KsgA/DIM1 with predicted DNA glycosylase/AP lyase activity
MLRQSLKGLDVEASELLAATGVDPEQRAEQLSVTDFARLAQVLDTAAAKR